MNQKQYQEALLSQINATLDELHSNTFLGVSDYLKKCYDTGYTGAMYNLSKQGIPLILPIDKKQVIQALETDSKLSQGLYNRLGEDTKELKKHIKTQMSRGIANGSTWNEVAEELTHKMKSPFKKAKNNAMRIVRTEGGRIQSQAQMDACYKAKSKGADVVKQWDATLDGRTRSSHAAVDGEIRELDEAFSNGLMMPNAPNGAAAEVCNCRCVLLQRARWALDKAELDTLKERAEYFGLDKTDNFEDFKSKYLDISNNVTYNGTNKGSVLSTPMMSSSDSYYDGILKGLNQGKIDYNPIVDYSVAPTEKEIIKAISGGDLTKGSCASVGLAYIGQKQGWDVLDFRDGDSRKFFSSSANLFELSNASGIVALRTTGANSLTVGNRLLKQCQNGKEYYLCVGRHAAIVRKTNQGVLQYLELQSAIANGWTDFNGNPRYTLKNRFGCTSASSNSAYWDFMIDIESSNFSTNEFKSLLGYINTDAKKQRKGANGTIK